MLSVELAKSKKIVKVPNHQVKAKEQWDMKPPEKLEHAEHMKKQGTERVRSKKWHRAVKYYALGEKVLGSNYNCNKKEKEQFKILRGAIRGNIALCQLKLNKYEDCVKTCGKVIDDDKANLKAHYRRACARIEGFRKDGKLGDWEQITSDCKVVLKLLKKPGAKKSDDVAKKCRAWQTLCEKKLAKQKRKEAEMYQNMFRKSPKKKKRKSVTTKERKQKEKAAKKAETKSQTHQKKVTSGSKKKTSTSITKPQQTQQKKEKEEKEKRPKKKTKKPKQTVTKTKKETRVQAKQGFFEKPSRKYLGYVTAGAALAMVLGGIMYRNRRN